MADLWEDIQKTIREGVTTIAEKTEELTKIGRAKVEILNIKRQIERKFAELGGKVYHLIAEEGSARVASNPEVKDLIADVQRLETQLEEKRKEIEELSRGKEASSEPEDVAAG
jgi:predicted RNase H-like nuclease (RuvC/YqgF family)